MTRRGFLVAGGILAMSLTPTGADATANCRDKRICDANCGVAQASACDAHANDNHWAQLAPLWLNDAGVPSPPTFAMGAPVSSSWVTRAVYGNVTARGPPQTLKSSLLVPATAHLIRAP